ncbi:efflux RND transporter periplasmic adaptor subunit [Actibacterium sp. 188UL27-1]|uniref:efflux RND transporter periplasmic adaptor subunit n=1 Tax=Actibacterium sp. 188UL27-1 TaxID=2786961 RepID=UPI00195E29A8|nr:efflux RND transporter periplasmic adaptor subunit [Actibacterium sp. 188UL27-1]
MFAGSAVAQQEVIPAVDVATPITQEVTDFDIYTGRFQAARGLDLRAETSGTITSIEFIEGAIVEEGDVLFVLDDRRARAEVARLEASMAEATATRDLARVEFDRAAELAERQAGAQRDVDQRRAQLAAAQAVLEATIAQLSMAQIELEDTVVRAPFSGRIGAARVDQGEIVDGGTGQGTVLTSLLSVDPIEIVFDASESDYLAYVRLDLAEQAGSSRQDPAQVRLKVADEMEWSHDGQIDFIDNRLDDRTGTIRVRAKVPNPGDLFTPGLFAEVRVPRFGPYDAVMIPDAAILSDQAGRIVYTLGEGDIVHATPIQIGQLVGALRVIRSGLSTEDRIVVDGLMSVQPGAQVEPRPVNLSETAAASEVGQ